MTAVLRLAEARSIYLLHVRCEYLFYNYKRIMFSRGHIWTVHRSIVPSSLVTKKGMAYENKTAMMLLNEVIDSMIADKVDCVVCTDFFHSLATRCCHRALECNQTVR